MHYEDLFRMESSDHNHGDNEADKGKKQLPKRWVGCHIEEEYFGDERKVDKLERKIAKAKDRSQYKKTDLDKRANLTELHKNIKKSREDLLEGRVLSIAPQGILVDYEGCTYVCSLRGLLKKEKSQFKNLVTVGDFVLFEKSTGNEGLIAHIQPRRSVLSRADNLSRRKEQLIAANIDQVIITVSVVSPMLKPYLADRYIIATEKGKMTPIIVVNKIDLLDDPSADPVVRETEREIFKLFKEGYVNNDVQLIPVSVVTGEGVDKLREAMRDKASVFSGQSGVGKSSLINAITGSSLRTGKIVGKTQKGSHTTTTTNLIPLEFGGWCIDTPGIKSFGVWNLDKDEIEAYFPEIFKLGRQCKYPNCSHHTEAGCAVAAAVEAGTLSPLRYGSYLFLMEEASQVHVRR